MGAFFSRIVCGKYFDCRFSLSDGTFSSHHERLTKQAADLKELKTKSVLMLPCENYQWSKKFGDKIKDKVKIFKESRFTFENHSTSRLSSIARTIQWIRNEFQDLEAV